MSREYRGSQCRKRSAGLTHVSNDMGSCYFCGVLLHNDPPRGVPSSASEARDPMGFTPQEREKLNIVKRAFEAGYYKS